jgi:hypothetical protein
LISGFAEAEVDELAETKGESLPVYAFLLIAGVEAFDKVAVKKYAKQSAEEALAQFGEF